MPDWRDTLGLTDEEDILPAVPPQDEPPSDSGVHYDAELQAMLEEYGITALREHGACEIPGMDDPARYNTAVWFTLKYGLEYVRVGDRMVCTAPDGRPSWA